MFQQRCAVRCPNPCLTGADCPRVVCADIKPDNMLLDGDGHVHLADFNVASYIPDSGLLRSRAGTRPYMGMSPASEARGGIGSLSGAAVTPANVACV
jgi:hypothetical protein